MSIEGIRFLFEPKSVAIVGVSRNPIKFGSIILHNLLELGYQGKIFPINPYASEIRGLNCFPSIKEINEEVEVAIIAIPAFSVPQVLEECGEKGVKGVIIISSGFREAGEEGKKRQKEIVNIAKRWKMRILGPNTTGILNPKSKFTSTFAPLPKVREGNVAFIAQTGIFAGVMLSRIITSERFGISKVVGLGNKCDVDESEVLEYLEGDEDTKVIMMYLEETGEHFLKVAKRIAKNKPIILLKGGRTPAGAKTALSHTGSLAGRYEVLKSALNQFGIIPAQDLEEMLDLAKIFSFQPLPRGPSTAIVSMSGGAAVMASDACFETGLRLAELSPETIEKLQKLLPPWAKASHPFDLEPLGEVVGFDKAYKVGLELALSDPNTDCCLLNISIIGWQRELPQLLDPVIKAYQKPVVINIIGPKEEYEILSLSFEERGIPVYSGVKRAAQSLFALYKYKSFKERE